MKNVIFDKIKSIIMYVYRFHIMFIKFEAYRYKCFVQVQVQSPDDAF